MHFLGCLFALFLGVFIIGVTFIGSIIDFILSALGLKKRTNSTHSGFSSQRGFGSQQSEFEEQQRQSRPEPSRGQQKGKIFTKDESEYVDFEEI